MFPLKQTYATLCELDVNERSYILNNDWKIHNIYNDFSQLIAHPYQRISQTNANYNLKEPELIQLKEIKNEQSLESTVQIHAVNTINIENDSNEIALN